MTLPDANKARLSALRRNFTDMELQALLVTRPENRRYLSGFTAGDPQLDESSGCLFITSRRQYILTDFRYKIEAQREAPGFDVLIYSAGAIKSLTGLIARHKILRMGIEEDHMTVKAFRQLREQTGIEPVSTSGLVEDLRSSKDESEVKTIKRALRITETALIRTLQFLEPGRTELEISRFLEQAMLDLGAEGLAFDNIVASGPNAALPHAVPTNKKIKEGETIIFDCGALYKGYRADLSRTIVLGQAADWIKEIYTVVRRAQLAAIEAIKPGMMTDEVDAVARDIIDQAGFGSHFGHGLGHGVGLATHEAPSLSKRQRRPLEPGMVVTVEPGIYLEGKGGVRLEELVLVTDNGRNLLNRDRTFYDWA